MQRRTLERLDLQLPLLGFGCMRLPLNSDGSINTIAASDMVDYALKNGINYFDTAYMYHNGQSESFIGEALKKYPRESYMLTTKLHTNYTRTKAEVEKVFQEQLAKCQVDYFDFYLLHDVDRTRFELIRDLEIYDFLKQKQAEGKIRYIGFSSHDDHQHIEAFLDSYDFDVVQLQINYLDWEMRNADLCYQLLEARGIPCIVMEPVKGGSLADVPDEVSTIFKRCRPEATPASFALRWVASLPDVKMVLSGMSNMDQLVENTKVMANFTPLSDAERKAILDATAVFDAYKQIPCTGCKYCIDCPAGVNIPGVFNLYNRQAIFGQKEHFRIRQMYGTLYQAHEKGSACINCRRCIHFCPQHIDIPAELKKADQVLQEIVTR